MNAAELQARLIGTFLEELDERVQLLGDDLLALEQQPESGAREELIDSLFRGAHSLKGASRSVGLELMEHVCHAAESLLSAIRDGTRALTGDVTSALFTAVDAIRDGGARIRAQQPLSEGSLAEVLVRLRALEGAEARADAAPPQAVAELAPHQPPNGVRPIPPRAALASEPEMLLESDGSRYGSTSDTAPDSGDRGSGDGNGSGEGRMAVPADPIPAAPPRSDGEALEPTADPRDFFRVRADTLDALMAQHSELKRVKGFAARWADAVEDVRKRVTELVHREDRPPKAAARNGSNGSARTRHLIAAPGERGAWDDLNRDLLDLARGLRNGRAEVEASMDSLGQNLVRLRMEPFAEACQGLPRLVRDLALAAGKDIAFNLVGGAIELDRVINQGMKDPLMHLVTNAVQHGMEQPEARVAGGKAPQGTITVGAELVGSQVCIFVSDDGQGLDFSKLRSIAAEYGMNPHSSPEELARLIFGHGVSTSEDLSTVSGRGVGLDVVKSQVDAMQGAVSVTSSAESGTRFECHVPLTLLSLRGLVIRSGDAHHVILESGVRKVVWATREDFRQIGPWQTIAFGDERIPVAWLIEALELPLSSTAPDRSRIPVVVVTAGGHNVGYMVDGYEFVQSVVVKRIGAGAGRMPMVSGVTALDDGRIATVLNTPALVDFGLAGPRGARFSLPRDTSLEPRPSLIVAEDSQTTRTLMKALLESAGFEVRTAPDGDIAWELLREQPPELVVSDVEMPGCSGFTLLERMRASREFKDLPVILVTALEKEDDRRQGMELGANAYLKKSTFDQSELIETIRQML